MDLPNHYLGEYARNKRALNRNCGLQAKPGIPNVHTFNVGQRRQQTATSNHRQRIEAHIADWSVGKGGGGEMHTIVLRSFLFAQLRLVIPMQCHQYIIAEIAVLVAKMGARADHGTVVYGVFVCVCWR